MGRQIDFFSLLTWTWVGRRAHVLVSSCSAQFPSSHSIAMRQVAPHRTCGHRRRGPPSSHEEGSSTRWQGGLSRRIQFPPCGPPIPQPSRESSSSSFLCVYIFNPPFVGYEYHTPMIMKFEFTSLKKE